MRSPHVRVLLGRPEDTPADVVIRAGGRAGQDGRIITVAAPRWERVNGPRHALPEAYRQAVAAANARGASSMALPGILARGPWPLEEVTRVAMTVLRSTPTSLREVTIAVGTPAMVEVWAEAIIREPWP